MVINTPSRKLSWTILLLFLPFLTSVSFAQSDIDSLTFSKEMEENEPAWDEFRLLDVEPEPINMDEVRRLIGYPKQAQDLGIEGKVIMRMMLDKEGNYQDHRVLKDPHPLLTKAVESQLPMLRFTAGIMDDKPVRVWVTVPFRFVLLNRGTRPDIHEVFFSLEAALKSPNTVTHLNLSEQNSTIFPAEVFDFDELLELDLSNNQIENIPLELIPNTRLKRIDLSGNPISQKEKRSIIFQFPLPIQLIF